MSFLRKQIIFKTTKYFYSQKKILIIDFVRTEKTLKTIDLTIKLKEPILLDLTKLYPTIFVKMLFLKLTSFYNIINLKTSIITLYLKSTTNIVHKNYSNP